LQYLVPRDENIRYITHLINFLSISWFSLTWWPGYLGTPWQKPTFFLFVSDWDSAVDCASSWPSVTSIYSNNCRQIVDTAKALLRSWLRFHLNRFRRSESFHKSLALLLKCTLCNCIVHWWIFCHFHSFPRVELQVGHLHQWSTTGAGDGLICVPFRVGFSSLLWQGEPPPAQVVHWPDACRLLLCLWSFDR
jgi:hypothetical protein